MAAMILALVFFLGTASQAMGADPVLPDNLSPRTRVCINCHKRYTPGIVYDWLSSRHAKTTVQAALRLPETERRLSATKAPDNLGEVVIGCYECHSLNEKRHRDSFAHMGLKINVVVTPNDCATCHPHEAGQYAGSKKAHAVKILRDNPLLSLLADTITGLKSYRKEEARVVQGKVSEFTRAETCYGCHGTKVEVKGIRKVRPLNYNGEITVPDLTNWPNQGVGRENPDDSTGSCSSCHARHSFSIKMARDPHTCGQCHLEPDVPAYEIYKEGKHGNLYEAFKDKIDFEAVPWVPGRDFRTPTCAACHASALAGPDGRLLAARTHDFGGRLWWRIFGLIYAHPQPKNGDTTLIRNQDGLPLPTTFAGGNATAFLIDKEEMAAREKGMKNICNTCHSTSWVDGHFDKFENTIRETNEMTKTATLMLLDAWEKGIADKSNPFDESLEQIWVTQWLFHSNSIRYSSAMTGAPDYATFKLGWWHYLRNLSEMKGEIRKAPAR